MTSRSIPHTHVFRTGVKRMLLEITEIRFFAFGLPEFQVATIGHAKYFIRSKAEQWITGKNTARGVTLSGIEIQVNDSIGLRNTGVDILDMDEHIKDCFLVIDQKRSCRSYD